MSLRTTLAAAAALLLFAAAPPVAAGEFMDAAGRRVVLPDHINRIMPANRAADVLVTMISPDRLVGWSTPHSRTLLPGKARKPMIGRLSGDLPSAGPETVMRARPDVVVDVGVVTPERIAFADQMQQQTGVPYILVEGSIARTPATLRSMGAVFGEVDRGQDLSRYARHAVEALHGRLLIKSPNERPHVYLARGPDGLETALPGSPAGEVLDEAGAINVATPLGRDTRVRVTYAQLIGWDPQMIICTNPRAYAAINRAPALRGLSAVRQKKVYLMPSDPFGWTDEPNGANRIVGLYWISDLFYPGTGDVELRSTVRDLYEKLYGIKLTDPQLENVVRGAGVPKSETLPMPLAGLGATPGTPLPTPGVLPGLPPPGRRGTTNAPLTAPASGLYR